jgi:hypothetical protein
MRTAGWRRDSAQRAEGTAGRTRCAGYASCAEYISETPSFAIFFVFDVRAKVSHKCAHCKLMCAIFSPFRSLLGKTQAKKNAPNPLIGRVGNV